MPSSFQRAPKRGSLLPSVVVLPKIGAERNENGDLTNSIRSDFVGNNSVVGNSGSFSNKKEVTKTHSQPNAIQDRTPSDGKSVIGEVFLDTLFSRVEVITNKSRTFVE